MNTVAIAAPKSVGSIVERRTFIRTVASASVPQKLTTFTSVSITRADKIVTATVSGLAPYLKAKDEVVISGGTGLFSGRKNVKTVTSTTFTWELDKVPDGMPAVDTVTVVAVFKFQKALWIGNSAARTANQGIVYLGDQTTDDTQVYPINPSEIHDISPPVGCVEDLQNYVLDVANANDGVTVFWC